MILIDSSLQSPKRFLRNGPPTTGFEVSSQLGFSLNFLTTALFPLSLDPSFSSLFDPPTSPSLIKECLNLHTSLDYRFGPKAEILDLSSLSHAYVMIESLGRRRPDLEGGAREAVDPSFKLPWICCRWPGCRTTLGLLACSSCQKVRYCSVGE